MMALVEKNAACVIVLLIATNVAAECILIQCQVSCHITALHGILDTVTVLSV